MLYIIYNNINFAKPHSSATLQFHRRCGYLAVLHFTKILLELHFLFLFHSDLPEDIFLLTSVHKLQMEIVETDYTSLVFNQQCCPFAQSI